MLSWIVRGLIVRRLGGLWGMVAVTAAPIAWRLLRTRVLERGEGRAGLEDAEAAGRDIIDLSPDSVSDSDP